MNLFFRERNWMRRAGADGLSSGMVLVTLALLALSIHVCEPALASGGSSEPAGLYAMPDLSTAGSSDGLAIGCGLELESPSYDSVSVISQPGSASPEPPPAAAPTFVATSGSPPLAAFARCASEHAGERCPLYLITLRLRI